MVHSQNQISSKRCVLPPSLPNRFGSTYICHSCPRDWQQPSNLRTFPASWDSFSLDNHLPASSIIRPVMCSIAAESHAWIVLRHNQTDSVPYTLYDGRV